MIERHKAGHGEYACGWCGKPESEWTNTFRWWSMKKRYCSAVCYSAGEQRTTQYLAACTIPIVGIGISILSLGLLSEPTAFYVGVVLFLITLFLVYSAAGIYLIVLGRNERGTQHGPRD
jgi:hypothetical protein